MSRVFWVAVGAVGGIAAYRRGTRAAARARELGPLGTAQVAAQATSRLAGRTANGLGRLQDVKARREGRLVIGSAEEVTAVPRSAGAVPDDWVPAPTSRPDAAAPDAQARSTAGSTARTTRPRKG